MTLGILKKLIFTNSCDRGKNLILNILWYNTYFGIFMNLKKIYMLIVSHVSVLIITSSFFYCISPLHAQLYDGTINNYNYYAETINIKSINGKFYAYIVLLFNENPHFVNMIQKDSIPLKIMGNEGFHIKEYKTYLTSIREKKHKHIANFLLQIYLEPKKFDIKSLHAAEEILTNRNIILKFSKDKNSGSEKISLDYCIFGKKQLVEIKHPFFEIKESIYNIQPFIYYDEFSTSNSTFYFDMIYINPVEVDNDSIIAKKIINGENVNSMFFVGSQITDDIKYCLSRAFRDKKNIKNEIWKMFIIHELTHKVLNNRYNNFDQVQGEELSMGSTMFSNPLLGLSVLYSYLNYNAVNPHRIAAMNYIRFIAKNTGKPDIIDNPGLVKFLPMSDIQTLAKKHFNTNIKTQK